MLFLARRVLEHELSDERRLRLLEKLQEMGYTALIRSTRLSCYERALSDSNQVGEMERLVATLINSEQQIPYVQGDLFCFEDHIFFLLFGDLENGSSGMRAGIVYEPQTAEPLRKLGSFCEMISLCLADAGGQLNERIPGGANRLTAWGHDSSSINPGFMRFVTKQDADSLSTIVCRENAKERVRAAQLLDDDYTRFFLRHAREAYTEGFRVNPLADVTTEPSKLTVNKLAEVGLLKQEVLVSCRKSGHTLFSLSSADALAVMTISRARCSECGANIADERIEEVFTPTQLSAILLEDGAWLITRLHAVLRGLGIPESEIAIEPSAGNGEARMMARVCGESFLIVMRDGDLTPAFARRAINTKIETEARHLMIVVTGTIHNEGRTTLHGFAKRIERGGNDFEMIIVEGAAAAAVELQRTFDRVSQKVIAQQLCELDDSIGLSIARLINARFQMLQISKGAGLPPQLPAPAEHVPSTKLLT